MQSIRKNIITTLIVTTVFFGAFTLPVLNDNCKVDAATKKVKLTYKVNGGKFTAGKYKKQKSYSKKTTSKNKIGKLPKAVRSGYKLKGWYTKKKGGMKVTKHTKLKKKRTVYARWEAKSYTVTLNANGGKISKKSIKVKYDGKYGTLPVPTFGDGKKFAGWYTKTTGGTKVVSSTKYKVAKKSTLYAVWYYSPLTLNRNVIGLLGQDENRANAWIRQNYGADNRILILPNKTQKVDTLICDPAAVINEPFKKMSKSDFVNRLKGQWKKVYHDSDTNDDGSVSIIETYELKYSNVCYIYADFVDGMMIPYDEQNNMSLFPSCLMLSSRPLEW